MNRIRELREAAGITQKALAARVGCEANTMHYYETGKHELSLGTIERLCGIFGVTADYLLGLSDIRKYTFTAQEYALIAAYRVAPENVRRGVDAVLEPYGKKERPAVG